METGKVEFAPDYKSEQLKAAMEEVRKIAESVIAANRAAAERARLERLVIEAAKQWRAGWASGAKELISAVEALNGFESSQQQKGPQ